MNDEKIMIEFTGKEMDKIQEYASVINANTVQEAIMTAIGVLRYSDLRRIASLRQQAGD